jgi:DNA-binding transcriptional MerR regulator
MSMNDAYPWWISIGPFARLTGLSQKALRLYAELGILVPAYVDRATGYRYYTADQIRVARLVGLLRRMDMPLATIRQVVEAPAPAAAERLVQGYLAALEAQLAQARRLADELPRFLSTEDLPMSFDVTVQTVPDQPILSRKERIKVDRIDRFIRESVAALEAAAAAQGLATPAPAFGIYYGPINAEDDGPLEVCLPVATLPTAAATDGLTARTLPGGRVASVMLTGAECDFPAILGGYDAVHHWITQNGYQMADAPREIWHTPPGGTDGRMEIAWPFVEKGEG